MLPPDQRSDHEAKFHDHIAAETDLRDLDVDRFFTSYTALENQEALRHFGKPLAGQRLLDLGCGYGEAAIYFSKQGAVVDGVDVSQGMLELASSLAQKNKVSPRFHCGPAETLPYPDGTFDYIFGNGVLHHVTLEAALPEIRRVLRKGGKAAFVEPLPYNPVINIYRRMATRYRSDDEHPLSRSQIRMILAAFPGSTHREFWIAGLSVFGWMYLAERVHPNDAPYWKKIIYDADRYRWLAKPAIAMDRVLSKLPGIRWLAWNTVLLLNG